MSLENNIKDCIQKELEKGVVEKVISEKLESCVADALREMFGYGGEVKKTIQKKVESVMIPYLENYDYSEYICKLDKVLVDVLKNSALENKKLLENFKELMVADDIPKNIKITDIFEKWSEYCKDIIDKDKIEFDCEGGYLTTSFDVEEVSSDWNDFETCMVRFECEEDEDLKFEFSISRWKKYDTNYDLKYEKSADLNSLRNLNKFDMFLMKINQGYNNIELDSYGDSQDTFIEYEH
ncbi:hypothetical protein FC959_08030 [Clostridium botulinum]|nr:hypothetical protein [Clostridium botulinum]